MVVGKEVSKRVFGLAFVVVKINKSIEARIAKDPAFYVPIARSGIGYNRVPIAMGNTIPTQLRMTPIVPDFDPDP